MKIILCILFLLSIGISSYGQFPAPVNLSVNVEYVAMDGMGWTDCGGTVLTAPDYCTRMTWSAPDTSSTESNLLHYNVYQDNTLLFTVNKDFVYENICGALTGDFYITASYTNPEGESEQSNMVYVSDELPIGLSNKTIDEEFVVLYDRSSQRIEIKSYMFKIESIALFDLSGKLIKESSNKDFLSTNGLSKGLYIVNIRDENDKIQNKKILLN